MQRTPLSPQSPNQAPQTCPPESKILLTVEEAAQRLSVGRTSMFAIIKSGQVRSVTIGKSRRVVAESLHEFVAARMADAS